MNLALRRKLRRPSWMTPFGFEGLGDAFSDRLWPEWRRDLGEEWTPSSDFYEKDGLTALGEATLQGHIDVVKLLLSHGASPEAGTTSALQLAEMSNRAGIMDILTE